MSESRVTSRSPSPDASRDIRWIVVAQLLRPQGRRGELLAELLSDFPQRFESQRRVFLAPAAFSGSAADARVAEVDGFWLPVGKNEGRIVLHFVGIDSINDAEALSGLEVLVPDTERLELDEDASYISDLIGCTLFDCAKSADPVAIGTVTEVQFATTPDGGRRLPDAAPLLAVATPEGEEVLVPFAKAFLISVDTPAKRIEMSLPAGLVEVNRPS